MATLPQPRPLKQLRTTPQEVATMVVCNWRETTADMLAIVKTLTPPDRTALARYLRGAAQALQDEIGDLDAQYQRWVDDISRDIEF